MLVVFAHIPTGSHSKQARFYNAFLTQSSGRRRAGSVNDNLAVSFMGHVLANSLTFVTR
jgi:hypothetical protein